MQGAVYSSVSTTSFNQPYVAPTYGYRGGQNVRWHNTWSATTTTTPGPAAKLASSTRRKYPSASGQLCLNFTRTGYCRYGDQCYHYHDRDSVAFCKGWLANGTCSRGGKCTLTHPDIAGPKDPRRTPECGIFLRHGKCPMADKCQYLHVQKKIDTPVCKSFEKIGFCEKGSKCDKLHYTAPIRQQLKRESSDDSAGDNNNSNQQQQQAGEGANPRKKAKGLSKAEIERKLDEECILAWEAGKLMKMYD